MKIEFDIIGTIHSPFKELEGMPIQPTGAKGIKGKICLKDEFKPGLKDIDGFSHLILIHHLHKTNWIRLKMMYCTFPMWTYLTELHFLTSSHTFLSYLKTL